MSRRWITSSAESRLVDNSPPTSFGGRPGPGAATPGERPSGWQSVLRRSWLVDEETARDALFDADGPALHLADFPSGHQIFTEDEPADRIYVIISGIVKITSTVARGRQVVRALLGPGDVLDEPTLFDAGPHAGTATCQSLVRTGWLNRSSLHRLIKLRPQLAQKWLQGLARELRSRDEDLIHLTSTDVPGRVARQLILLAERFGEQIDGSLHVTHALSRQEFAQLVGAARESVSKALAGFIERGWVVTTPGGYRDRGSGATADARADVREDVVSAPRRHRRPAGADVPEHHCGHLPVCVKERAVPFRRDQWPWTIHFATRNNQSMTTTNTSRSGQHATAAIRRSDRVAPARRQISGDTMGSSARVLIIFGSKRGGTAGLVDMVADALMESGCEVDHLSRQGSGRLPWHRRRDRSRLTPCQQMEPRRPALRPTQHRGAAHLAGVADQQRAPG